MKNTASPRQERAQKTKEKILKAAISMYEANGYHKTTVDEIAAAAEVSTGIAYRYFKNKKDLLLSSVLYAFENIRSISGIKSTSEFTDKREYLEYVLDRFEKLHIKYHDIHEELEGLRHTDKDVKALYNKIESSALEELINEFTMMGITENTREKVYFAVGIIENYCHMKTDEAYVKLDHAFLRKKTIDTVFDTIR